MKRKLFTLLFALVALASFQVNAQVQKYLIWSANYENEVNSGNPGDPNGGTLWGIPNSGGTWPATDLHYAKLANLGWPAHLNVTGGTWKWVEGKPINQKGTRFILETGTANRTKFKTEDGTKTLTLSYEGIPYNEFVIFTSNAAATSFTIHGAWAQSTQPNWLKKTIEHAGYLSVNTAANPKDPQLIIVVVNQQTKALELKTVEYLRNHLDEYAPFAFFAEKPEGRWATTCDFDPNKYYDFDNLKVADAEELAGKKYNTFKLTQVDWVGRVSTGTDMTYMQSGENIFGHSGETASSGAKYYVPKFEGFNGSGAKFGTQQGAEVLNAKQNDVIPLFILSAPEDGCKVVSVSRKNDLRVQSKPDGGYGNKLELRDFGTYYDYAAHSTTVNESTYAPKVASDAVLWDHSALDDGAPKLNEWRVATSLQKFAIWIDEDGDKSIYPLATYSWKYGIEKKAQKSTVLPNSVIMYNNPLVDVAAGSTTADKSWGIKIDVWETGATNTPASGEIVTGPNIIQTMSEYVKDYYFNESEHGIDNGSIEGRFFFLDAQIPDYMIPSSAPFGEGGYQEKGKTEYVLSTDIQGTDKHLIALPKERVRKAENQDDFWYDVDLYKRISGKIPTGELLPDQYWHNNPYDSVRMAAHWAIFKTQTSPDKYMLVNMLGDTLRYNPEAGETNIYGGYLPVNSRIATTRPGTANLAYQGFFSPEGASTGGRWFGTWQDPSTLGFATDYEWEISAIPGHEGKFILKLNNLSLAIDGAAYQGATVAVGNQKYFQYNIKLAPITAGAASCTEPLNTWADLEDKGFSCTGGLLLEKKEIYYVPNFSASYGDEEKDDPNKEFINTGDLAGQGKFEDTYAKVYNDSLTAYLLLDGTYAIKEADAVGNNLLLSPEQVGATGIFAAAFATDGQSPENETAITFIPLAQSGRTKAIRDILNASGQTTALKTNAAVDTLYGETYKWFVVKDYLGRYLRFDTIAPNAPVNQQKVGFIFDETSIANATPIRLYQPLVGDKLQGNFIIQFQLPVNTYDEANPVIHSYKNVWPDLTATGGTGTWPQSTIASGSNAGRRLFGELYQQSSYILGTIDPAKATRFTYVPEHFDPQVCCEETFVTPAWMAKEKILGLPVANEIWTKVAGQTELTGINKGFGQTAITGSEAVIVDGKTTELIHEYVGSIVDGKFYGSGSVIFKTDVAVPLYRIKLNTEDGKYLTVGTTSYQYVSGSTQDPDVTGVNLIWADKITTGSQKAKALQLFAISGPESAPDSEDWYAECSPYVYLPVASYKVKYSTGDVITAGGDAAIFYNVNLGMKGVDCNKNDITKVFRVGQYSPSYRDVKNLVVNNALGVDAASFVPVEVKWKKQTYDEIPCNYKLVKNVNDEGANFYYAAGGDNYDALCTADENTILAHWQTPLVNEEGDPYLYKFVPEEVIGYGSGITEMPEDLAGEFYFRIVPDKTDATKTTVIAYNFKDYLENYTIAVNTFEITCVDHALPFANLEKKYTDKFSYVLPSQLAILESPPYVNRNLAMSTKTINPTPINNNAYQVYINPFEGNIKDAQYLSAYKTYSRFLTENDDETEHEIPYYAFSIKKDGREYFLNVHPKTDPSVRDSVYWTAISAEDHDKLINGDGNADMKLFQFCLPYQLDKNGNRKEVNYLVGSENHKFNPTYLQTLDLGKEDYPYLVVTGASSQYVTARRLNEAMLNNNTECPYTDGNWSLAWNIYTVDYSQIDSLQVTAWIFAGQQPGENEWVPLRNANGVNPFEVENPNATIADFNTDGSFTNFQLEPAGTTFVAESNMTPVNYGLLIGNNADKVKLHFEFRGKEEIGTLWKVPIYYYQIQAPGSKGWLTDSEGMDDHTYTWVNGLTYDYASFEPEKLVDQTGGSVAGTGGVLYDKNYRQTFGLLYYNMDTEVKGDYKNPDKTFVVVSGADFKNPKQNYDYRYLAEVNGRMVFVRGIENALVFQYGRNTNSWTDINVVGQGNVFGVSGGIKVLNQTGTVDLYTIDGRLIKSVEITGADQTITAPRGVVIVKADGKATKVVVK